MKIILDYSPLISIVCTIITSIIAFLTFKNNIGKKTKEEITENVKRDTTISTKLDMVLSGNNELKEEIKMLNNKIDFITERIARCEEKTKNLIERVDKLEEKVSKEW